MWTNGLCVSSRACTTMPGAMCRSMVNTVRSLAWELGVHQGSLLSPLLFILVLEVLSRKLHTAVPRELLYADDLVLIADTQEECMSKPRGPNSRHGRLAAWKVKGSVST